MRTFESGATRDDDTNKFDFEGFLSPLVLHRFAEYMHKHRKQGDGALRASDNWQKGIDREAYMKSLWRHFFDVWAAHRGLPTKESQEEALCALLFNAQGYLFELLSKREATVPSTPSGGVHTATPIALEDAFCACRSPLIAFMHGREVCRECGKPIHREHLDGKGGARG